MKVLHLNDQASSRAAIELHPQITVLRDLGAERRAWAVRVLSQLGAGQAIDASGAVEAHGIRFDLDRDSLTLLGLEVPDGATVVTAADLPGHDPALAGTVTRRTETARHRDHLQTTLAEHRVELQARVEARDGAVARRSELERGEGPAKEAIEAAAAEASRLEDELHTARQELAAAEARMADAELARDGAIEDRVVLRTRLDAAQNRRRIAVAEATQAAGALESARAAASISEHPGRDLDQARERLEAAERALAEVSPEEGESPLGVYLTRLERRRVELARIDAALTSTDATKVAGALEELTEASSEGAPIVAALALADSWRDLHQQISALEAGVSTEERHGEAVLEAARQAVVDAESEFNQPILTPEQISKVEAAHQAVLESQERAEGRFGGSRTKRRLEELRSDERRVLERLGFSTYADYMMSSSSRSAGPTNRSALDAARAQRAQADADLVALPGAADRVRRRIELLQRREDIAPKVAELLGHEPTGPEAEDELRHLREQIPATEPALEALADALIQVGVDVGSGPPERDDVVLLARAYLAEDQNAQDRRTEVADATAKVDLAIGELRAARERSQEDVPDDLDLPGLAAPRPETPDPEAEASDRTLRESRWAGVENARSALDDAEVVAARQNASASEARDLEALLESATEAEQAAAAEVATAESELGSGVEQQVNSAAERVTDAERILTEARATEADVVSRIDARRDTNGIQPLLAANHADVAEAETAVRDAAASEQSIAAELSGAEADLAEAIDAELAAVAAAETRDRSTLVDDTHWALLGRLAAVRNVGPGGSAPVVLDDPFTALTDDEVPALLDRLAQMAGAVQIVVVSDRAAVAAWAERVGPEHVTVSAAA